MAVWWNVTTFVHIRELRTSGDKVSNVNSEFRRKIVWDVCAANLLNIPRLYSRLSFSIFIFKHYPCFIIIFSPKCVLLLFIGHPNSKCLYSRKIEIVYLSQNVQNMEYVIFYAWLRDKLNKRKLINKRSCY